MAKFLNKKEQVYDLQLTSYGRYTLSIGSFKPTYYAFYDDNVIYDHNYTRTLLSASTLEDPFSGSSEPQNAIHKRIKEETQYLESFVLFEDVEEAKEIITYEDGHFNIDINPVKREPRKDIYRYNTAIGDAFLDGDSNVAPAWKLVTLQGEIMSVDLEDATGSTRIPQINIQANYTKEIVDYSININPTNFEDIIAITQPFSDGKQIRVVAEDILIYGEELNTELLIENFDVEVYEIVTNTAKPATGSIEVTTGISDGDTIQINDGLNAITFEFDTNSTVTSPNTAVTLTAPEYMYSTNATALKTAIEDSVLNITILKYEGPGKTGLDLTNTRVGVGGNKDIVASNTNAFTIEGMDGGRDGRDELSRKYFQNENTQIQDGFMTSETPTQTAIGIITTASVEYWFDFLADQQIDQKLACKGAEIFNKESYYIDIDFDCEEDEEIFYYDIYGAATEPEICQD